MTEPAPILLARDADRDLLRRDLARGDVARVRRGAYLRVDDLRAVDARRGSRPTPSDPRPAAAGRAQASSRAASPLDAVRRDEPAWTRLTMLAVASQLRTPVFSHESAALCWGWPTWTTPPRTHVTQRSRRAGTASADIARHFSRLPEGDVVEREGLLVTSRERTVIDIARTAHPLRALVVADAALADGVDRDAVLARVASLGAVRGTRRARCVLTLADAGAESPWETWLRYVALRVGLPRPVTQAVVRTRLGDYRADLAWLEHRVLAEFDGRVKYTDGAFGDGYDGAAALFAEKRRTDAIVEATGVVPFRATARDDPEATAARLLARFPRAIRDRARPHPLLLPVRLAG
ncbi:hypothetical protein [Xylanimonas ulmi]|uniref:Transcriptional regulator, AbiEi antitoxin, Type IV TA system n=1 Tax=Xylanimonas ulmi TaxID=228973 RepID=A0A4Q7M808_9MICO|nr:hypothetical protein [Xylanibacterium ulmi]RZS63253.1 hypothetical protein EV386_3616 [Xylanibacterium ulmi]